MSEEELDEKLYEYLIQDSIYEEAKDLLKIKGLDALHISSLLNLGIKAIYAKAKVLNDIGEE